ncbi:MAG: choice-of-anchor tandem repeat GloVer-containing protein [Bryobacteraceae bacterium]
MPNAGVVIGVDGVLYGTTLRGGTSNDGTIFSLTPPVSAGTWTETVLHNFAYNDGFEPYGRVAIGEEGALYVATEGGGSSEAYGTVISLTPPASRGGVWIPTVILNFLLGAGCPNAGVIIGPGGVLYGTTLIGGALNAGTVFSLAPPESPGGAWTEVVLHDFAGYRGDGLLPYWGVVMGNGGVLYGTTWSGGLQGAGTIFSLTPPSSPGGTWTEAVIHNFGGGSHPSNPYAGVVIGSGGVLYGTSEGGGTYGYGTVFSLTPPAVSEGTWTETVLHNFTGDSDGAAPVASVVIGSDGLLYGTTSSGGASGVGTVFSLRP